MRPQNATLKANLTAKQTLFCSEYCFDFNATRAAIVAGYSRRSAAVIGRQNLIKPNIQSRIKGIMSDLAKASEMSALKLVQEHAKIAFSDAGQFRLNWITMKDFKCLTPEQKACIQEISTKVVKQNIGTRKHPVIVNVEYVKLKLYDKQESLDKLSEMLGFNAPVKQDVKSEVTMTNFDLLNRKIAERLIKKIDGHTAPENHQPKLLHKSQKQVDAERQESAKNGVPYFNGVEAYIPQGEVNCWKRLGGVVKIGGEFGLFGVPVGRFQRFDDYVRIYDYSDSEKNPFKKIDKYSNFRDFSGPSNSFCILEVDLRSQGRSEMPDEIEFRKCNVLFVGNRIEFLKRVKMYVDQQEYDKICEAAQGKPLESPILYGLFKDDYQGYQP